MEDKTLGVEEKAVEPTTEEATQAEKTALPTQEEQVVKKDVYEKVREAMQKERAERKELQAQLDTRKAEEVQAEKAINPLETPLDASVNERVLKAEANAQVAIKLAQDVGFRDRMALVQEEMQVTGKTLEEADSTIKARLYDQVVSENPQQAQAQNFPVQLNNSATQEQPSFKPTGDVMKDIVADPNTPDELKKAMARKFGS